MLPPIVAARYRITAPLCEMTVAAPPSSGVTWIAGSCSVGVYARFSSRVLSTKAGTAKVSSSITRPAYRHMHLIGSASARTAMYCVAAPSITVRRARRTPRTSSSHGPCERVYVCDAHKA